MFTVHWAIHLSQSSFYILLEIQINENMVPRYNGHENVQKKKLYIQ